MKNIDMKNTDIQNTESSLKRVGQAQKLNFLFSAVVAILFAFSFVFCDTALARTKTLPTTKVYKRLVLPVDYVDQDMAHLSEAILPTAIDPQDSSRSVISKIVDNSLSYWYNHSGFKETSVGRAAANVEKKMRADVDLGTDKNKVEHKLSFKILATQALAKLEYVGWFRAALNYDARAAKAEAEVFESLAPDKDLIVSQSVTPQEQKSQLALRWNW
jgi:hypothetical protein